MRFNLSHVILEFRKWHRNLRTLEEEAFLAAFFCCLSSFFCRLPSFFSAFFLFLAGEATASSSPLSPSPPASLLRFVDCAFLAAFFADVALFFAD